MSWASGRRTLIVFIVCAVIAAVVALTLVATLYETPTCFDGKQNQDEEGVDCGGGCELVCTLSAVPPTVVFVREVPGPGGRTDVIAYIDNKNPFAAAYGISYTVELYGEDRQILATKTGTIDLPPVSETPLYLPGVYQGDVPVAEAFMTFDESMAPWYRYTLERKIPSASEIVLGGTNDAPRVTATIRNPIATPFKDLHIVATVFNEEGNAIAASQTILKELPGQGSVPVIFTWSAPFISGASRIDVRAVVPLNEGAFLP